MLEALTTYNKKAYEKDAEIALLRAELKKDQNRLPKA